MGKTSRGRRSLIRPSRADVRVCVGAVGITTSGYSGGVKAIIPGVASAETIQHNHRRMTEPNAVAGHLDDNPVRCDIEEAGELVGAHFILNVILDESKAVVSAVAGHPRAAHREGCARLDAFGRVTVEQPADVVFVSAGGYPKDINLYQAQRRWTTPGTSSGRAASLCWSPSVAVGWAVASLKNGCRNRAGRTPSSLASSASL
jgi:nickel-dependent lactate racemase